MVKFFLVNFIQLSFEVEDLVYFVLPMHSVMKMKAVIDQIGIYVPLAQDYMMHKEIVNMENVFVSEEIMMKDVIGNQMILIYKMVVGALMEDEMNIVHKMVTFFICIL